MLPPATDAPNFSFEIIITILQMATHKGLFHRCYLILSHTFCEAETFFFFLSRDFYLKILGKETEAQESKVIHPQSHSEQEAALGLQNLSSFSQILF